MRYEIKFSHNPKGIPGEYQSDRAAKATADLMLSSMIRVRTAQRSDLFVNNLDTNEVWVRRARRKGLFSIYWED